MEGVAKYLGRCTTAVIPQGDGGGDGGVVDRWMTKGGPGWARAGIGE